MTDTLSRCTLRRGGSHGWVHVRGMVARKRRLDDRCPAVAPYAVWPWMGARERQRGQPAAVLAGASAEVNGCRRLAAGGTRMGSNHPRPAPRWMTTYLPVAGWEACGLW
jgi:hypothetical protein